MLVRIKDLYKKLYFQAVDRSACFYCLLQKYYRVPLFSNWPLAFKIHLFSCCYKCREKINIVFTCFWLNFGLNILNSHQFTPSLTSFWVNKITKSANNSFLKWCTTTVASQYLTLSKPKPIWLWEAESTAPALESIVTLPIPINLRMPCQKCPHTMNIWKEPTIAHRC